MTTDTHTADATHDMAVLRRERDGLRDRVRELEAALRQTRKAGEDLRAKLAGVVETARWIGTHADVDHLEEIGALADEIVTTLDGD